MRVLTTQTHAVLRKIYQKVPMPKFRKKPVVIEAFQVHSPIMTLTDRINTPDWFRKELETEGGCVFAELTGTTGQTGARMDIFIRTLEGDMLVSKGDYIIKGVAGEIYPCKADIFEQSYEPVE